MFAPAILAAVLTGQFSADPAPNVIPIRYVYIAHDPDYVARMRAYAMSPTDGMAGFTKARFEQPFRRVPLPLDAPTGVYFIYLFPGMPLTIPTR